MLGRVRRTTRTDVGLAISFAGVAYLVWAAVIGAAHCLVEELSKADVLGGIKLPTATRVLCNSFIHGAVVWDAVGVLWLLLSLVLIVGSSRQRWSISWPWMSTVCQAMVAALIAACAGVAAYSPHELPITHTGRPPYPTPGWTTYSIAIAAALVMWVWTLVWLIHVRARFLRGPSLRDGLRTHIPG